MIYRIHKKNDEELYITTDKNSSYNKHSLSIPKNKLENFILDYPSSNKNMVVSYFILDEDVKITKSYYDKENQNIKFSYDEYFLNKKEFMNDEVCIAIIDKIDEHRIENSSNILFNAYLNEDLNGVNKDKIDISESEFSDYIYENSSKLAKLLKGYKFNDLSLDLYESGFILSCVVLASSIPIDLFIDKDLSVDVMLVGALATISFYFLKNDRRNKLIYDYLIKMINNKNDHQGIVRKKSNLNNN